VTARYITMATTVGFNWTKADILRAGYVGLRSQPLNFALSVGFFIVVPWLCAFLGVIVSVLGGSVYSSLTIAGLIVIPPVAVGFLAWLSLFQVRGARALEGTHTYEFSETDIHLKGPGFDNHAEWGVITVCYGRKQGLLFKSGNASLISVPGRALSSAARAELRRLIVDKGIKLEGPW